MEREFHIQESEKNPQKRRVTMNIYVGNLSYDATLIQTATEIGDRLCGESYLAYRPIKGLKLNVFKP